jgi:hypothetical protein
MLGVTALVLVVVLEYFLQPGLDPASHQISEYVHGASGWLMTVGFLSWSLSLAATGLLVGRLRGGGPMRVALMVAAIGMLVTACFATQTVAGRLPVGASLDAAGRLHDIGSGVTSIAILAASALGLRVRALRRLRAFTISVLLGAVSADVVLLAIGSEVGGVRQRALVSAGCLWQSAVILATDWSPREGRENGLAARRRRRASMSCSSRRGCNNP